MAFRNGGGFNGSVRNAYQLLESFTEIQSESHYKFIDYVHQNFHFFIQTKLVIG